MKICIIDIDGVLNTYPDCYLEFVDKEYGYHFETLNEMKDWLGYAEYKRIKEAYRTSGYKESLVVSSGAVEFMKHLKEQGYYIIILSARPVDRYNTLIMQTTNWLKKNEIEYDYLMFNGSKNLEIIQKFDNVEFVVEDNRYYANSIAKHGYQVFLVSNRYNAGKLENNVQRVQSLTEIKEKYLGGQRCQKTMI